MYTDFGMLRHGQTEWNTLKRIQGSADSPLTEFGKIQVNMWAKSKVFKDFNWQRIIASDLGRARETAAIINHGLGLPLQFDKRLREQNWGDWEGLTIPFIWENFEKDLKNRLQKEWDFCAPNGETRKNVCDRASKALIDAAQRWPSSRILVICHQGTIKCLLYHLTQRDFQITDDPFLHHNKLHIVRYQAEKLTPIQLNLDHNRQAQCHNN